MLSGSGSTVGVNARVWTMNPEFPLTYRSYLPGRGSSRPGPWRSGSRPWCRPGAGEEWLCEQSYSVTVSMCPSECQANFKRTFESSQKGKCELRFHQLVWSNDDGRGDTARDRVTLFCSYLHLPDVGLSLLDELQVLLCDDGLLSLSLTPLIFPVPSSYTSSFI